MSVVDDLRKLLQDVVTPDLKALDARMVALEKRLDQKIDLKFDLLDKKIDLKFDLVDKKIDHKTDSLILEIRNLAATVAANQASIMHTLDIDRRMERIENTIASKTN